MMHLIKIELIIIIIYKYRHTYKLLCILRQHSSRHFHTLFNAPHNASTVLTLYFGERRL